MSSSRDTPSRHGVLLANPFLAASSTSAPRTTAHAQALGQAGHRYCAKLPKINSAPQRKGEPAKHRFRGTRERSRRQLTCSWLQQPSPAQPEPERRRRGRGASPPPCHELPGTNRSESPVEPAARRLSQQRRRGAGAGAALMPTESRAATNGAEKGSPQRSRCRSCWGGAAADRHPREGSNVSFPFHWNL